MKDSRLKLTLISFFNRYIEDTGYKEPVRVRKILLCEVSEVSYDVLKVFSDCAGRYVFISTKSLKHIYDRHLFDKKTPRDFVKILENLVFMVKNPDEIRKDPKNKRGDFLFIKEIESRKYFVSLEIVKNGRIEVVSSSVTGLKYLKKFSLLWSWRTANPPS